MNTDWLRSFVEVARQQSYSRAAERLYLSQPTVYHHVKLLEGALTAPLVEQRGKRTELTAQGRLLIDRAARIIEEVESLPAMVQDDHSPSHGRLAIGAASTFGAYMLPWLMTAFHCHLPGVSLSCQIVNDTEQLDQMVRERRLDVAINPSGRQGAGVLKLPVFQDPLMLAAPADHRLARLERIASADLAGVPLVSFERSGSFWQALETWSAEAGEQINVVMTFGSQESIKTAVMAGAGLAVLSYCAVADEVAHGRLAAIPLRPRVERHWYVVLKTPVTMTHSVEAFLKMLHSDTWLPAALRPHYLTHPDITPEGGSVVAVDPRFAPAPHLGG